MATSIFSLASLLVANDTLQPTYHASAAAIPEACFTTRPNSVTSQGIWITGYAVGGPNNCPSDLVVPSTLGGETVTTVGAILTTDSYNNQQITDFQGITSFTLPSTVTKLAQLGIVSISQLVIPATVTSLITCTQMVDEPAPTCNGDTNGVNYENIPLISSTIPWSLTIADGTGIAIIPTGAFMRSNLRSVSLGQGIVNIGWYSFRNNAISSLVVPSGVVSIGDYAFESNQITSTTLPATLTSNPKDFLGFQGTLAAQDLWDNIPIHTLTAAQKTEYYANTWYVRVYTALGNPQGYQDYADVRAMLDPDTSEPTDESVIGWGYLISPARATATYKNTSGAELQPVYSQAGKHADGTTIPNYLFSNSPVFPAPAGLWGPNPTETIAIQDALKVYHRLGDTTAFTAPTIPSYSIITPTSPHTMTLASADNTLNFVYSNPVAPTTPSAPTVTTTTTPANPTTITINWTPAPTATSYTIQYKPQGSSNWQTVTISNPSTTTHTLSNLTAGTTYDIQVITALADGSTATSATVTATAGQELAATGDNATTVISIAGSMVAACGIFLFAGVRRRASRR